ncbi:hypothetical protein [Pseudarthrobacter siccitolerans]
MEIAAAPLLGDELLPEWAEEERALDAARVSLARVQAAETALALGDVAKAIAWGGRRRRKIPLTNGPGLP